MKRKWKHASAPLSALLPYLAPQRWVFLLSIVFVVAQALLYSLSPVIEGSVTTQLASDAADMAAGVPGAHIQFDRILPILTTLVTLYLGKTACQAAATITLTNATQETMRALRSAVQKKIHALPVQYFDTHPYGDILSRITNDVDTLSSALQQTLLNIINGLSGIVLAITMMFQLNARLALIALIILPMALLITGIVVHFSQKQFAAQQTAIGDLNARVTELYTGYHEILLYNKQEAVVKEFHAVNEKLRRCGFRAQFGSSLISPCISLVTYLVIGTVATLGALAALEGTLAVGSLQAFIRYIWQLNDPLSQISQLSAQIQSAFAAARRVTAFLSQEEEGIDAPGAKGLKKVRGEVTFEDVHFGYGSREILHGLSFTAKPGQTVAIVGPTGAGKTTIINLLLRFYEIQSGRILLDGHDIRSLPREDLRRAFGMVLQDTWLFSGSLLENLRYGRPDAPLADVISAAKGANVHDFILSAGGYDALVNEEGDNISQGEKQLLTIARAVLRDPPVLILDEATSSVDTRLEKRLQGAMQKMMEGRTCLVIAHRLSTIRNADLILVLRDGRIVEQGKHDELLKKDGAYAALYNAQFQGKEI